MERYEVSNVFCDWCTSVSPYANAGSWLRKFLSNEDAQPTYKGYHREHAVQYYPSGIRHYYSPNQDKLPSIIVVDGKANSWLTNEFGESDAWSVIRWLARESAHLSRIDIAIDILDGGFLAHDIARETLVRGMPWGRRKAVVYQEAGDNPGCTTYVGARTSPKFLRIYDKSAESHGVNQSTRIEFELKAEAAEGVGKALAKMEGLPNAADIWKGLMFQFNSWDNFPQILDIITGDCTVIEMPKREPLMDKKEWLMKQVAPTFIKNRDTFGVDLWHWFVQKVTYGIIDA